MANCIIHPIPLCQAEDYKSAVTYLTNFGQRDTRAEYVWYIEGAREKILVDAGDSLEFHTKFMGNHP